ncbi:MAG: flavin reductase family protein [Oligoflexia bacterium]|nr:flavin reductase family protein [Oligoflexia bacterium]
MQKKSLSLGKVYGLLEPGPVILLTTASRGRANVMTQSWHTMIDFEPPLVGLVVSDRNYSYAALKSTKECVINIPTADIAKEVVGCGNLSGQKVDKFKRFHLTREDASMVQAPLIQECFASFECRVVDTKLAAKYGFFVVEVVKAWMDPSVKNPETLHHRGKGVFMVAGKSIRLPSKML